MALNDLLIIYNSTVGVITSCLIIYWKVTNVLVLLPFMLVVRSAAPVPWPRCPRGGPFGGERGAGSITFPPRGVVISSIHYPHVVPVHDDWLHLTYSNHNHFTSSKPLVAPPAT